MSNPHSCLVSFTDSSGIQHSVEVVAGSLYEAAAFALAEFRRSTLIEVQPGTASQLTVSVKSPTTSHQVPVATVQAWVRSNGKSPSEQILKRRLREVLESDRRR